MKEIVPYYSNKFNRVFDPLNESLVDQYLNYQASELVAKGYFDYGQLLKAIDKAMNACRKKKLKIQENFKLIYISKEGTLYMDWRLSKIGRKLVLSFKEKSK